jgi:hypothetical protein
MSIFWEKHIVTCHFFATRTFEWFWTLFRAGYLERLAMGHPVVSSQHIRNVHLSEATHAVLWAVHLVVADGAVCCQLVPTSQPEMTQMAHGLSQFWGRNHWILGVSHQTSYGWVPIPFMIQWECIHTMTYIIYRIMYGRFTSPKLRKSVDYTHIDLRNQIPYQH